MPVLVSPGVYVSERDFSLYAPELATSIFGIVITASKGPTDELTLVTDVGTLEGIFGPPKLTHYGIYAAQKYLSEGRRLWVVRVAHYDVTAGDITIRNEAEAVDTLAIRPTSSGSWFNDVSILTRASAVAGRYTLVVLLNALVIEKYENLLLGAAHVADQNYITTRINGVSPTITVEILDDTQTTLEADTFEFDDGEDGAPADDSDIIGSIGDPPTIPSTGLCLFENPETLDLNLLAVPGVASIDVINKIISVCESRGDCMGILAVPFGKTVQEAVNWHNGDGGGGDDPAAALNTSYASLHYPWLQIYDSLEDQTFWVGQEGHIAAVIAHTDYVADPWHAPAGLERGMLRDVRDIEHSPTQGERDYMYGPGNNVNPVINLAGQGFVVWGQKTLQRTPTALDRINVRRMLLYMRKIIATAARTLLFRPNDARTWRAFTRLVAPVCNDIQSRRGIYAFRVICDETTNTPVRINRNEMHGRILIQPTKTAEIIHIEFTLLPSGASFEEL